MNTRYTASHERTRPSSKSSAVVVSPPTLACLVNQTAARSGSQHCHAGWRCRAQWGRFGREYQLLSLILFSLTFPGSWPEPTFRAFFSDISLPWFSVAGMLLLFGYVGGYEDTFPVEVVVQWVLAVPIMLFITHRFASRLLPRLIVLEGGERTAVVVGAGKLGRQLAEAFDADRYSGIKFAGYFDDRIQSDRLMVSKNSVLGTLNDIPET